MTKRTNDLISSLNEKELKLWLQYVEELKILPQYDTEQKEKISKPSISFIPNPKTYRYLERDEGELPDSHKKDLRAGKVSLDLKVDLHHLSLQDAYQLLQHAIFFAAEQHLKKILIITGKSKREQEESLFVQVPRWLNNPSLRPFVSYYTRAHPKHGGEGALYVCISHL